MNAETLSRWLQGNQEAIDFISIILQVVEIWDDLIDKDKDVDDDNINGIFYAALVSLPRLSFYRQNFDTLSPIIESAIFDWRTANSLEKKKDHQSLVTAYTLRCSGLSLIVISARIIGGHDWAMKVSNELRNSGDAWEQYRLKHGV